MVVLCAGRRIMNQKGSFLLVVLMLMGLIPILATMMMKGLFWQQKAIGYYDDYLSSVNTGLASHLFSTVTVKRSSKENSTLEALIAFIPIVCVPIGKF